VRKWLTARHTFFVYGTVEVTDVKRKVARGQPIRLNTVRGMEEVPGVSGRLVRKELFQTLVTVDVMGEAVDVNIRIARKERVRDLIFASITAVLILVRIRIVQVSPC
jgi:hypothetical protein